MVAKNIHLSPWAGIKKWFKNIPLLVKIFIILLVVLVSWFGYKKIISGSSAKIQYQTATAEKSTLIVSVSASGSVLSTNKMDIITNASGIVSKVYVKDGDTVSKGQKIAEIELDSIGAQKNASAYQSYQSAVIGLTNAQNNLRSAQATLDRVYDDIKGHDTNESFTIKETRTKAEVAKDGAYNSLRLAQLQLSTSYLTYKISSPTITADKSGTIKNVTIVAGMTIGNISTSSSDASSGERVAIIESKGNSIATFNVSEIDVSKVLQGQKATITVDSISDKSFTGKVVSVDRMGTVSSGVTNYPVLIQFDNEVADLLPNMSATANIIIEMIPDTLLVPTTAIQSVNSESLVRVLKNGVVSNVTVETGSSNDSQTQIKSGLNEGDVVVISAGSSKTSATSGNATSPFSGIGRSTQGGSSGRGEVRFIGPGF